MTIIRFTLSLLIIALLPACSGPVTQATAPVQPTATLTSVPSATATATSVPTQTPIPTEVVFFPLPASPGLTTDGGLAEAVQYPQGAIEAIRVPPDWQVEVSLDGDSPNFNQAVELIVGPDADQGDKDRVEIQLSRLYTAAQENLGASLGRFVVAASRVQWGVFVYDIHGKGYYWEISGHWRMGDFAGQRVLSMNPYGTQVDWSALSRSTQTSLGTWVNLKPVPLEGALPAIDTGAGWLIWASDNGLWLNLNTTTPLPWASLDGEAVPGNKVETVNVAELSPEVWYFVVRDNQTGDYVRVREGTFKRETDPLGNTVGLFTAEGAPIDAYLFEKGGGEFGWGGVQKENLDLDNSTRITLPLINLGEIVETDVEKNGTLYHIRALRVLAGLDESTFREYLLPTYIRRVADGDEGFNRIGVAKIGGFRLVSSEAFEVLVTKPENINRELSVQILVRFNVPDIQSLEADVSPAEGEWQPEKVRIVWDFATGNDQLLSGEWPAGGVLGKPLMIYTLLVGVDE